MSTGHGVSLTPAEQLEVSLTIVKPLWWDGPTEGSNAIIVVFFFANGLNLNKVRHGTVDDSTDSHKSQKDSTNTRIIVHDSDDHD